MKITRRYLDERATLACLSNKLMTARGRTQNEELIGLKAELYGKK